MKGKPCHNRCRSFTFTSSSTKDRRPFLRDPKIREMLHAYLGEVSKRLDCPPILVGVEDHVHLLGRFGRAITQAEWVRSSNASPTSG